jgi:[CysO sulfur-carrier protein]-S-L-cysteine hydrolase
VAPRSKIVLTEAQRDQIFSHCLGERPNEGCGLLGGRGERVEKVYLTRNKERSAVRYEIEPADLIRVFRDLDDSDLDLVGIFHSHVFSQPYPSQTDVRLAFYPDAIYLVVSLANEREPVMRGYTIVDAKIDEVEVALEP